MAHFVNKTVRDCESSDSSQATQYCHQKSLRLFATDGPLESIDMDFLVPLPKKRWGNQHFMVIKDRFSKFPRAFTFKQTTSGHVAQAFVDHWVMPYGIPKTLLSDNGPPFVSNLFAGVCIIMDAKQLTTTAHHPQTNGQTERYYKTIVARLSHYVAENQPDWDEYVRPLTYAYNLQLNKSNRVSPFYLTYTRSLRGPETVLAPSVQPSYARSPLSAGRLRMGLIRILNKLELETRRVIHKS